MAVGFVIKRFYKNGNYEFFQGMHEGRGIFTTNIMLALEIGSYEHAMEHIELMDKGVYQIEKLIFNVDTDTF